VHDAKIRTPWNGYLVDLDGNRYSADMVPVIRLDATAKTWINWHRAKSL